MLRTTFAILGLVLLTAIPDSASAQSKPTYDLELLDPLLAIAVVQEEAEDYQGAITTLSEALFIYRANFGLFDAAQVEILDSVISIQQREQNWEEVDALYATMEQVYLKSINSGSEIPDAGLDKVVEWHLYAFREDVDGHSLNHIEKAGNLMRKQLELAESAGAEEAETLYLAGGIAAIDQFLQWNKVQRNGAGGDSITIPVYNTYEHE